MDEYIEKNKIINLLEHNDKVYHYADRDKENIVHDTVQTLCRVIIEAKAADVQTLSVVAEHIKNRLYETAFNEPDTVARNAIADMAGRVDFWVNELKDGDTNDSNDK